MSEVALGRAGSTVLVDLEVCAKTGRTTNQRVTLRGSTTPDWVVILLAFTVVGFLLASAMTSRRYHVTLPLRRETYLRWKRNKLVAWMAGIGGAGALIAAATDFVGGAGSWFGIGGVALVVAALVGGAVNGRVYGLGLRMTRDDELILMHAHPAFARAVSAAGVEHARR